MKATKDYISLETAKLLEGKLRIDNEWGYYSTSYDNYTDYFISDNKHYWRTQPNYPAYTWQEILRDGVREFLLEEDCYHILNLLQEMEYEKADKYFRDNCILIKKTPMI
jgi:hypothetical protein